jgi:hypothetical protein
MGFEARDDFLDWLGMSFPILHTNLQRLECANYAAVRRERLFEVSDACLYESEAIACTLKAGITIRNGCRWS